jgi:hypothetical protein
MRVKHLLFVLAMVSPLMSTAQTVSDSIRYAESIWSLKKKAILIDYLTFSEAQKSAFWPIYDSYSNATQYLEMESVSLLRKYSQEGGYLSASEMDWIASRIIGNDVLLAKLRKKYFKKMRRAVSSALACEFMQFDNAFRNEIRSEVQKNPNDFVISSLGHNTRL